MAFTKKQIAEIVQRYDGGDGDTIEALAEAFDSTPAAIKYRLKAEGHFNAAARREESDNELGIGEDDGAGEPVASGDDALAALLQNPALQKLVERAVEARLAQMGQVAPVAAQPTETTAVIRAIEHLLEVQSSQTPGYIKPLSAEEVDKRLAAHVEMKALIQQGREVYERTGNKNAIPLYILGELLYDSTNAIAYEAGSEIRSFLEPGESFVPMNEPARQIHAAFIASIGGPSPDIGARVAEAMIAAKGKDVPLVGGAATPNAQQPLVEVVPQSKRHDVKPKRVLGTITPETHGSDMPMGVGRNKGPDWAGIRRRLNFGVALARGARQ